MRCRFRLQVEGRFPTPSRPTIFRTSRRHALDAGAIGRHQNQCRFERFVASHRRLHPADVPRRPAAGATRRHEQRLLVRACRRQPGRCQWISAIAASMAGSNQQRHGRGGGTRSAGGLGAGSGCDQQRRDSLGIGSDRRLCRADRENRNRRRSSRPRHYGVGRRDQAEGGGQKRGAGDAMQCERRTFMAGFWIRRGLRHGLAMGPLSPPLAPAVLQRCQEGVKRC